MPIKLEATVSEHSADTVPDDAATVEVALDALDLTGSVRVEREDDDHVQRLAHLADLVDLPPIVVHHPTMRVVDGHHRVLAARRRGRTHLWARLVVGSASEAFVLGIRLNVADGLPLTLADRKAAARRMVETHPEWSDRSVASITGLAARTVAGLRDAHAGVDGRRVGRDGRARPVDRAARRAAAAEMIRENPQASLRAVAVRVGLSPETVRSVRAEITLRVPELPAPALPADPGPARILPVAGTAPAAGGSGTERRGSEGQETGRARLRALPAGAAARGPEPSARGGEVRTNALRTDPSLRYSASGRALIRLLEVQRLDDTSWQQLLDSVPAYCADLVASSATACAIRWMAFAEEAARRGSATHDSAS